MSRDSFSIGTCEVSRLTFNESLSLLVEHLENDHLEPIQHCSVNASKVVLCEADAELRAIVNTCAIRNADGMAIVWASRISSVPLPERVTGIDLAEALLAESAKKSLSVFLLGGRDSVVVKVAAELQRRFPGLSVAGARHGYWNETEEEGVVREVRDSGAQLLLLGFPSPKKEFFASKHLSQLGCRVVFGVGGAFDVWAGKRRRAPRLLQKMGLEWAFRFAQEPRRMLKRYTVGNAKFLKITLRS